MIFRKDDAASRPKSEFTPKTLVDLNVEGISEGLNGAMHSNTKYTAHG